MNPIAQADAWLFQLLNLRLVHPAADDLMVFLTSFRLSVHIFLLAVFFIVLRKGKEGLVILFLAVLAVGISDQLASGIMKPLFQRVRPCYALAEFRLLVSQPGTWSFASSHAANAAAVASMIWIFFWRGALVDKAFSVLMIVHGSLVAYSRIYVGVHYPGDVLGGIVTGLVASGSVYTLAAWLVKNGMLNSIIRGNSRLP
jgi:undecaprenyl-diphosphatase